MDAYLDILKQREIRPTAIRLLILKAMMRFERAFSLLDLENELDTGRQIDRIEDYQPFPGSSPYPLYRRRFRFFEIFGLRQRLQLFRQ